VVVITKKNRKHYLPSVSGVLLRGVQRGTCVGRWVCRQVRMWLDTALRSCERVYGVCVLCVGYCYVDSYIT